MKKIENLEFQRLIGEFQFVKSDYYYQSEIIKSQNPIFIKSIESVVESHSSLKEIWNKKETLKEENIEANFEIPDKDGIKDDKLKKIYHKIVKLTHPDKVQNEILNNIYIDASNAYEENDIMTLYSICGNLYIDILIDEEEINMIREKIEEFKTKISFLKETFTYKWMISSKESDKNKIIISYIKDNIR